MLPIPRSLLSPAWRLEKSKELCLLDHSDRDYKCPYIKQMCEYIDSGETTNADLEEAYLIYYLPSSRSILVSLLITQTDIVTIAGYIGSNENVVVIFGKLFFDVSVFPNRLVLKEFIDTLPDRFPQDKNFKSLLRSAYSMGSRYIAWKLALNTSHDLEVHKVTETLMEDCYWRAREHRCLPTGDPRNKESRAWIPQVLKSIECMGATTGGGENAMDTLRLKLVKTDTTYTLKELESEVKG